MKSNASFKEYYNEVLKEISSASYFGRSGYKNGDIKAAKYIIERLAENGAKPLRKDAAAMAREEKAACPEYKSVVKPYGEGRWSGEDEKYKEYLQHFEYPLNVMRGSMKLSVDGKEYRPAVDFIAKEFSPSCKGDFDIVYLDESRYVPETFCSHLSSGEFRNSFVVLDWKLFWERLPSESWLERYFPYLEPLENIGGIILKDSKPEQFPYFKARSYKVLNMPVLVVNSNFPSDAKRLSIDMESEMIEHKDGHNILAVIEGAKNLDKYTLFIAHYDHLGVMGEGNIYPGANDNGSGTAMVLALSKYYSMNRPDNSVVFFFPDAEESNLLGSFYYAENPYFALDKIADIIFNIVGLIVAFAGFIAVLFVGVFLAASSVYGIYLSFSLEGAGKVVCGIVLSLLMLASSGFLAYADVLIVKTVFTRLRERTDGSRGGDKTIKAGELSEEEGEAEIAEQ